MSSILKALQKLENDKASRQTKEPDISSAIIREKQRRSTPTRWILPIAVTAVAASSVILTYTFMGGFSADRKADKQLIHQSLPSQPPISSQIPAAQLPSAPSAPSALPPVDRLTTPTLTEQRPKQPRSLPTPSLSPSLPAAESTQPASVAPKTELSPLTTDHSKDKPLPVPLFSINGIAWQKDSASRLAVVNGVPIGEGGMVEGAKIEQIFQDRVRFSLEGKSFEVSLERDGRH